MADVKWIKITTDIFDDEKILLIESLPDAYAIITVWFKLLCLAGKQNNSGVFMMGKIAYTDKMLATIFRMKEATVTMALNTFEQFGMVEIIDGVITIPNWGKHQNLDQLESKKEYMRNYMQEYRAKQKALTAGKPSRKTNSKTNVSQADKEEDKEIEKERESENIEYTGGSSAVPSDNPPEKCPVYLPLIDGSEYGVKQSDVESWTMAYPAVNILTELHKMKVWLDANPKNRKTSRGIKKFIIGWLGRTQDKAPRAGATSPSGGGSFNTDEFFEAAVARAFEEKEPPKTAADDDSIRERAEALKQKVQHQR